MTLRLNLLALLILTVSCAHRKEEVVIASREIPVGPKREIYYGDKNDLFDFLPYSKTDKDALKNLKLKGDIIIAVIDSGIDCTNPWIKKRIWVPKEMRKTHPCGYNAKDGSNNVEDKFNHGTTVASLILAMHPRIKVFPIKSLSIKGDPIPSNAKASELIIKYKKYIKVVNISMDSGEHSHVEEQMMKDFRAANISVVVSSGNSGLPDPMYPARLSIENEALIVVGGSYRLASMPHRKANFNWKSVLLSTVYTQFGLNNKGQMTYVNGTSFSAPIVSATVGLMRAINPSLTPAYSRYILQQTVVPQKMFFGRNVAQGELNIHGALSVAASVKSNKALLKEIKDKSQKIIQEPTRNLANK